MMMKGTVKEGILHLNLQYRKSITDSGDYQKKYETKQFNLFDDRVATDFDNLNGEAMMFDETLLLASN